MFTSCVTFLRCCFDDFVVPRLGGVFVAAVISYVCLVFVLVCLHFVNLLLVVYFSWFGLFVGCFACVLFLFVCDELAGLDSSTTLILGWIDFCLFVLLAAFRGGVALGVLLVPRCLCGLFHADLNCRFDYLLPQFTVCLVLCRLG